MARLQKVHSQKAPGIQGWHLTYPGENANNSYAIKRDNVPNIKETLEMSKKQTINPVEIWAETMNS